MIQVSHDVTTTALGGRTRRALECQGKSDNVRLKRDGNRKQLDTACYIPDRNITGFAGTNQKGPRGIKYETLIALVEPARILFIVPFATFQMMIRVSSPLLAKAVH